MHGSYYKDDKKQTLIIAKGIKRNIGNHILLFIIILILLIKFLIDTILHILHYYKDYEKRKVNNACG